MRTWLRSEDNVPEVLIHYFAQVRDRLGREHDRVTLPHMVDTPVVLAAVRSIHPLHVALIDHCRVAVDLQFITTAVALSKNSEIALIPPVSGG
jgi:molybdopterin converting factor small subunit